MLKKSKNQIIKLARKYDIIYRDKNKKSQVGYELKDRNRRSSKRRQIDII